MTIGFGICLLVGVTAVLLLCVGSAMVSADERAEIEAVVKAANGRHARCLKEEWLVYY
jgi:hypothetical protein